MDNRPWPDRGDLESWLIGSKILHQELARRQVIWARGIRAVGTSNHHGCALDGQDSGNFFSCWPSVGGRYGSLSRIYWSRGRKDRSCGGEDGSRRRKDGSRRWFSSGRRGRRHWRYRRRSCCRILKHQAIIHIRSSVGRRCGQTDSYRTRRTGSVENYGMVDRDQGREEYNMC